MPYTTERRPESARSHRGGLLVGAILVAAVVGGFGVGWLALTLAAGPSKPSLIAATTPTATASATAGVTPSPTLAASASDLPSPTPTATPTVQPLPTATPPLPAMLAAIGDSYSQAYSVSPANLRDHPQYSWVVGTARNDGVTSLLERFKALGATPGVVDAATSGRKMIDAQRQVEQVVAAAANLQHGQTAYVTFMLGTNDLCDDPKTPLADFTAQARAAVETLRVNLPPGSRLLMMPVPDFSHFRAITQADPTARTALLQPKNSTRCAPFLGSNSPASIPDAEAILASYNAALETICDEENAVTGALANLHCTYNQALLSGRDFVLKDLSTVDYFHPSLTGQAKFAADAWKADAWANGVSSSARSDQLAGTGERGPRGLAPAALGPVAVLPAVLARRRRRPARQARQRAAA